VILRDFPAVSLPAIFGILATLWAIQQAIASSNRQAVAGIRV
jgi:hypothetical protein